MCWRDLSIFLEQSVVLQINEDIFTESREERIGPVTRAFRFSRGYIRGWRIDPSIQLKEGSALDYSVRPTTTSCRTLRSGLDEERSFDIGPRPNSRTIINTLLFSAGSVSIFMAAAHEGEKTSTLLRGGRWEIKVQNGVCLFGEKSN